MKKYTAMAAFVIMLMAGFAGAALFDAEDTAAATNTHSISGDTTVVATEGKLTFEINFYESDEYSSLSITYTAKLINAAGTTQSSAVSPSSGSLTNGVNTELTVTAPDTAGTYTLTVTYTETVNEGNAETYTDTQEIQVKAPIKLSITLENTGSLDLTDAKVYFYLDDKLIEDSKTTLTVAAGDSDTITYDYVPDGLSSGSHTFKVLPAEGSYIGIDGLGDETTFYYNVSSYDWASYLMAALFVVMLVILVYVMAKPVKNYGKPKARR
ncbi:MAG: CARDB domain-containing protein [Candidatus Methanomethylophilus sp.]|nr:CARDB domain-containing protein [Methanomethylophilus sp.]MDD4668230.1 CARDB domain-containing protein [Methanomethylophilus sp.]